MVVPRGGWCQNPRGLPDRCCVGCGDVCQTIERNDRQGSGPIIIASPVTVTGLLSALHFPMFVPFDEVIGNRRSGSGTFGIEEAGPGPPEMGVAGPGPSGTGVAGPGPLGTGVAGPGPLGLDVGWL